MLNEKTDEELQEFFENKTGMPVVKIYRNEKDETARIILDNEKVLNARRAVFSFFVTSSECQADADLRDFVKGKEKLNKDWQAFLASTNNKNVNI